MLKIGGIIFIFVGIAIVCDEYFQPALEVSREEGSPRACTENVGHVRVILDCAMTKGWGAQ